jgi:hypothetical protein
MTLPTRRSLLTGFAATFVGCILCGGTPANPLLAERSSALPAASEPQRYWFTDVATRSVFPYRTNNDFRGRKYFPQPMCGGVAAFDYDNDSFDDLFLCNTGRNALYHNNGDGTFTDVTSGSGLEHKPPNVLSVGAAWFDYNNDGLLDLIITNYTVWTPETDLRCQTDDKHHEYCSPTVYKSIPSRLYRNLGAGRFDDVTESSGIGKVLGKGMGIAIADFNNDGRMDIFVANDTEPNLLFLNQGDGTFKAAGLECGVAYNAQGTSVSGMGCDAKDFDNDGLVDIVYNDLSGQVSGLLRNEDGKSFADLTWSSRFGPLTHDLSGWSMGFIDYNNDAWKDIYSANGDADNLAASSKKHDTMFQNLDSKKFANVSAQMGPDFAMRGYQRGSAFVDLNNDGFMDLVITSLGQRPRIFINNALVKNHWIIFDLRGQIINRNGIGARIRVVTASGRSLYNHVTTIVGFMSSSDRRAHFGLGAETEIDHVEIRWPSVIIQRINHPATDQNLKVEEPSK